MANVTAFLILLLIPIGYGLFMYFLPAPIWAKVIIWLLMTGGSTRALGSNN